MEHEENQVEQFHDHDIMMSYFSALAEELISLILSKTMYAGCQPSHLSSDQPPNQISCGRISCRPITLLPLRRTSTSSVFQSTIYLDNDTKLRRTTQVEKYFMGCNPKASM
ncbi:hypothetical protein PanWU01x14_314530 [Parasponia andersonii]|uniref:Uncharacterized protein n=1 Tax=Parasponia andersonii TaxID=3476 RepID=A0A2P5ANR3_PARAD|nr:hypothetical protein PanWU01x14_314530 [Parasponia andersonii]